MELISMIFSGTNLAWADYNSDVGDSPLNENAWRKAVEGTRAAGGNAIRWWLFNNMSQSPAINETTHLVSGLKEKEKVDIFKDVSIKVNGISPECTVSFSYSGDVCSPYSFSMKRVDGKETTEKYKNGDKIIVSLTDEAIESLNKEYIIEETSREYTIQADKKYILSADDLSEKDAAALKKISDDYADNRFIKLNDWTQEEAAIVISKLTGLNRLILASEGNTHIKSVENMNFDSAYVGIGKTTGYFGQVKEERFAYFFYVGDLTYSYKNKETLLSDLALLVRLQDPVIDTNGKISYSNINFGVRKNLDAAQTEMLNGDFDKIA